MSDKHLFVIDDEFSVLYTIEAIMEEEGVSLKTFSNPLEALNHIAEEAPKVIITDLSMPEINGIEVLSRTLSIDADIQVIMLTAHGSEKVAVEAMKMGAFYYITKPFDPEELKLIVKKGFEQYSLKKKIKYDMEVARSLQVNLLPKKDFSHPDFKLSYHYFPSGNVGGDFFDYLFLPDGSMGLLIADAAGHGVASAMIMAMLKVVFMNLAPFYKDPASLLRALNDQFYPLLKTRSYFTAFYSIFTAPPYRMIYSTAGHPFPLFCKKHKKELLESDQTGMGIGMFPDPEYSSNEIPIEKGDCILFYTDGLSDIKHDNNFFNFFRNQFLEYSYNNCLDIFDKLVTLVDEQKGQIEDDITMVIFQNNNPKN